jgi:polysaccharide biosynthesis transport protein
VAAQPEFDDEIVDYRYYLGLIRTVVLKYYKVISVFCALCVIASVAYVQSQAPVYASTVTMHIAPNSMGMFSFEQWMWSDDEKFQDTQIGILQSKKLHRRVVEKISLHEMGKLTPASFDAGIANSLKNWIAGLTETPVPVTEPEAERVRAAASELASLISIAKPPNRDYSNLLNITVRMADPELAAITANTIADEYIAMVFENEIESARKNQQFLSGRLTILRQELKEAENRLQSYREAEDIVTRSSGLNEVDEELASLSNRYFEARENRLRQENLYQQLKDARPGNRSAEKLQAISNHPSISTIQSELFTLNQRKGELSKRYGSRHNKMISLESEIKSAERDLEVRTADVIAGISNEYELAVQIERAAEKTLNSVRDRKQQLGMPLLGYLPLVDGDVEKPGLAFDEYINNPESRYSEALRTIRTSINLSTLSNEGVQRFLVTSSQSHEGKTSVALSLAAAIGHTRSVLLIDGDLRRPSIERILNQSNHKAPGLSDVIAQNSTIEEAIQHRDEDQIDVMFAGSRTLKPLELLSSRQFGELMDELGKRYDAIIIDSPPCIAVSDAYVLATQVDSILFVTKCNEVAVPVIRTCINRFAAIDTSILGVILNQIDFDATHHYGKYQDYYHYHGYGEDDPAAESAKT